MDKTRFDGTCEPRIELLPRDVVEIRKGVPHTTQLTLDAVDPLADPVNRLEAGHEYRVTLKPQHVWGIGMSIDELFRGRDGKGIPIAELPDVPPVMLKSDDEIYIKVEG